MTLSLQRISKMVNVAQLVRASDCGSEGRGFDPRLSPLKKACTNFVQAFFDFSYLSYFSRLYLMVMMPFIAL